MRTFVVALALATVLAGCGRHDREDAAAAAAERFAGTVRDDDGAAACALLAPATRAELEEASGSGCADALVQEDLPDLGSTEPRDGLPYDCAVKGA